MGGTLSAKTSKKTKIQRERESRPNIFSFHDYRAFLKEWLTFRKKERTSTSLRQIAQEAAISPSLLTMVISGSRKLNSTLLSTLGPALKLDTDELLYLEILVTLGNATTQKLRTESYRQLCEFRKFRDLNPKEFEVFKYLTHWYYVAIREMSALPGFSPDANWIQDRLRYSVDRKEVERAIEFLLKHGYIESDERGQTLSPKTSIDCMGGVYKLALTQFHQEMLSLAARSIEDVESENRNILGYTLMVNDEKLVKIRQAIDRAHAEIRTIAQEPIPHKVEENQKNIYHVQLTLFPLTKKPSNGNETL